MKSGNLNCLEPSGPLQAFNGTALPYYPQTDNDYRIMKFLVRISVWLRVISDGTISLEIRNRICISYIQLSTANKILPPLHILNGARCWWRSCLRHCATSRKVAGSIPDGVIGIFHFHVLIVLKSGRLYLMEPSRLVQACYGIALLYTGTLFLQAPIVARFLRPLPRVCAVGRGSDKT